MATFGTKNVLSALCFLQTNGTTRCNNFGPMGCIYKEILDTDNYDKFKIQSGVANPEKSDVTQCMKGCRTMFPNAYFVGVLHKTNELECLCLQAGAFNASMLGPNVQCNQVCINVSLSRKMCMYFFCHHFYGGGKMLIFQIFSQIQI